LLKASPLTSLSANPGPLVGPGPPVDASLLVEPDQRLGRSDRSPPSPRSLASPSSPRLPWRLCRLTAVVLDSDELRRSPPLRCRSIDRSSDGGFACPRDLLDCFLVARIPFASEARDLGHGDLKLAPELLGLIHGENWASLVSWCFVDVSSATTPGSMPSWPRGHYLAMPRWYLQGIV
jgi:hypothetical protein